MASYRDTGTYGESNSGSLISFESMAGEDVEIECENRFHYARPVQDTQPPDPGALLGPARYRYSWPGGRDLQQNAIAADSQASLSIAAVSSGDLVRIETRLRSLADQFRQIEDGVSNLHTAIGQLTTCTMSSGFNITTPQRETPLGASGPYSMANVRMVFWEAKKCQERDFSASTAQCLGQTLTTLEAQQSPHKETQSSRKKQSHVFLGIKQCPAYFTLHDDSAVTKVATSRGVGVVWSIRLSRQTNNSQHIPRETTSTATIYSGRLLACPNCSCLMQLGAQIKIQNTSSGVAVDLLIKRLDIVRIPTGNRLFRYVLAQDNCCCEIKTYYIIVKVHFGDSISRQTFWKFTI